MCYLTAHCSTTSHSISVPMSAFPRASVLLNHDSLYKTSKLHSNSTSQLGHVTNVPFNGCKPSATKNTQIRKPDTQKYLFWCVYSPLPCHLPWETFATWLSNTQWHSVYWQKQCDLYSSLATHIEGLSIHDCCNFPS